MTGTGAPAANVNSSGRPLILVHSRMRCPWVFNLPAQTERLSVAHYTVSGFQHLLGVVAIDRKRLLGRLGRPRITVHRSLEKLRALRFGCAIFECGMAELSDRWPDVLSIVIELMARHNCPFLFAEDRRQAARLCESFLVASMQVIADEARALRPLLREDPK